MSHYELDDDIFSPLQCTSFDNSTSYTESSITDVSNIDLTESAAKCFIEPQKPNDKMRFIGIRSCSDSFSEVNDQLMIFNNYDTSGSSPYQQQDAPLSSCKLDASGFSHKTILKKETNIQDINIRNKVASKFEEKVNDRKHIKKTYHNKFRESNITNTPVGIVSFRKEKNKARLHCSKEDSSVPISNKSSDSVDSRYMQGNKKAMVTSATQTEVSYREVISPEKSNSGINEKNDAQQNGKHGSSGIPVNHYQVSVQKIIHDAISTECDKIRQLLYAQRLSSFRRIDEILAQHEFRIMVMQERLLKVVEELAKIHFLLNKSVTD